MRDIKQFFANFIGHLPAFKSCFGSLTLSIFTIALAATLSLNSCRKQEPTLPSTGIQVTEGVDNPGAIKGFYLLNEGNMGSNKASLDYFDYKTGIYTRNIYGERNPEVVKELGDVGNDLQIYGDRLYAVINCSNLVEVMDVATTKSVGRVSIPNCRYIVFDQTFAYVSSYAGAVEIDPNYRLGYIAKVDLRTLNVVAKCEVGYQPEEMAIVGDRLYVANSGGYMAPNYDNTLSVVDLETFTQIKKIEVGINPHHVRVDSWAKLWVSSRGDNIVVDSKIYVVNTATDMVEQIVENLPCENFALGGELLYSYGSSVLGNNTPIYAIIDTKTKEVITRNFITDGTDSTISRPYGVAANQSTGEIFVTDAKDFVTPGKLRCFSAEGKLLWSVTTGDAPARIVFVGSL